MTIHGRKTGKIEDGRSHSSEVFTRFRALLRDGAAIKDDPKRPDFFELPDGEEVFYFYLSPVTGDVLLLAVWAAADAECRPWLREISDWQGCPGRT